IKFAEENEASSSMKQLIRGLLKRNPVERMNFKDFFESVVVKGDIPGLAMEDQRPRGIIGSDAEAQKSQRDSQQLRQEREGKVADAIAAAERERERAAQDVAFERDYVVVEKRAVEVNAFADELAASPRLHQQNHTAARQGGATSRLPSTTATPHSPTTGPAAP